MPRQPLYVAALLVIWSAVTGAFYCSADEQAAVAGVTRDEALSLGEKMYREGLLPSGEPMQAIVQGDIAVEGTMFTCATCHLRSGVGSIEGAVITLPTNAGWLYEPLVGRRMKPTARERLPDHLRTEQMRPAYTDESLARALREGVDPSGRELDSVMPRYTLEPRDMELMLFYLKNLSATPSPGVDETTMRFATVITDEVSQEDREAMLSPLQAHIDAVNAETRQQGRRARQGPFYKEEVYTAYRRLDLSVWLLEGPPATWRAQLESYYQENPVFALLSGISTREWRPIHEFCEERQIPALFPITDLPVISENDWYTVYFSKGWYQEGETVARYLSGLQPTASESRIVQVVRDTRESRALQRGFDETRKDLGGTAAKTIVLAPDQRASEDLWRGLTGSLPGSVVLLWLGPEDLADLQALAAPAQRPETIFLSDGLVGGSRSSIPEEIRGFTYLTRRTALPGDKPRAELAIEQWLRSRRIPITNKLIQSKMYAFGGILSGCLREMRHDFYRDYLLDVLDMMRDQYYTVAAYDRLSFGPGQRFASKGCYIVQLGEGPNPELIKASRWVVH